MVVDSSVWIEIFVSGKKAKSCKRAIDDAKEVTVPTVVLYEIYKKIKHKVSEESALEAVASLSQYKVEDFNREIAMTAADLSLEHKIAMADSIVLAHALNKNTELLTLDNDFRGIPGAKVL